ncbi:MAG: class I SAM-dependent methyltransferase [Chloroflexi bacterium]|nr:class I SAM-dependent methyltransferase [Chloroflexota bacterium]
MTEERQTGVTAMVTAFARAYHATHDTPKIFDDYLAPQWFSDAERAFLEQNMSAMLATVDPQQAAACTDPAQALAWVMQHVNGPVTLCRSRYAEDCLEAAVRAGVGQYVLLGAGLDSFAFRSPAWAAGLQIFEVDHPATQALKRQRLAGLGWPIPAGLHFIPLDFTRQSLEDGLKSGGYQESRPAFFSWLGVTYYLDTGVVLDTLEALARLASVGSQVVFDYQRPEAFDPQHAGRQAQAMQRVVARSGEPMKTGFDPQALAGQLARLGLRLEDNLGPAEIEARYFQGRSDDYHAFPHIYLARAGVA